ncbi:MAG: TrbC/VirB2 family protein [Clostridia bacterium]|nr:TrbC/VirB2 family protein [Clostridia bacterium]
MKKAEKILNVLVIVMAIVSIATNVFADFTPANVVASNEVKGQNTIANVSGQIVGVLQTVGVVLSVVILIVIGIKYMMGSAEEKAEYKKTFIPYIVGAALIFAASVFANTVYDFFIGLTAKQG